MRIISRSRNMREKFSEGFSKHLKDLVEQRSCVKFHFDLTLSLQTRGSHIRSKIRIFYIESFECMLVRRKTNKLQPGASFPAPLLLTSYPLPLTLTRLMI